MKANLIKSLRNKIELVDIEAGRSARANFPGVNFDNAVLLINGRISEPDTIIKNDDIVTLRQIPADLTDTPWWVATFLIPFGFLIQPAELAYKARQQADEAERELEKMKKLTNAPSIDNSPFLRGATNTIATGKSQPYFCGRNFLTPYLFSQPFYKISGTDGATQEVFNILEFGFKDIVLNKIGIGDTTIKTFTGSTPQNDVFTINEGLFANGQIATQYCDLDGNVTMDDEWNINGSYRAVEGILSPDGRCLGKMAHSERRGDGVAINIYGEQDLRIFESGVAYFK